MMSNVGTVMEADDRNCLPSTLTSGRKTSDMTTRNATDGQDSLKDKIEKECKYLDDKSIAWGNATENTY